MNLRFIFVGKNKDDWISHGEEKYLKYLKKYSNPKIEVIKEELKGEIAKIKKTEGEKVLNKISEKDFVILLDVFGKEFSSEKFASEFEKISLIGKSIVFVIAGAYGPSQELRKRSDLLLSFSKMTFTHQMVRLILLEQVFRAFSILKGSEYHK